MPAPIGTNPYLAAWLNDLESRLAVIENPQAPTALFPMASTNLTTANALTYINRQVFATDLGVIAYSTGAHWLRSDSGGVII
jgi:hypothetical protein